MSCLNRFEIKLPTTKGCLSPYCARDDVEVSSSFDDDLSLTSGSGSGRFCFKIDSIDECYVKITLIEMSSILNK